MSHWSSTEAAVSKPANALIQKYRRETSEAALQFESRWTMAALRRAVPDIALRLHDQKNLFVEVCIDGSAREVRDQGEALIRGYAAAVAALEQAGEPDDAYMLGTDLVTGTKVAIGQQRAAVKRIREIHGEGVIWVTPDEVARMLAGIESFKLISAVKNMFPGAEILDRYPDEAGDRPGDEELFDAEPGSQGDGESDGA